MAKTCILAENLRVRFGPREVLRVDRLELRDGDRVGLVGENGAGKTTLLRALSGEITPDEGTVRRFAPIASIRQMDERGAVDVVADPRVASEFAAREARDGLSGGERTRRRIAGALSSRAAVLFADEPTSDLDADGVERLERALASYDGALMLVSHDRALLDAVCNTIYELRDGALTVFPGNYTAYREEKARRMAFERFEYDQYRDEQARLRASIQGKREHATQVGKLPGRMGNSEARLHRRSATEVEEKLHKTRKALESRLNQLEVKERPREDPSIRMALGVFSPITSKVAIELRDMTLRVPGRTLLENARAIFPTGARTALVGPNGCGKTTLIARILGGGDPRVRVSPGVKIGWFGQDHESVLDMDATALANVLKECVYDESVARTVLARLGLRGDDVFKRARVLSGGERAKVCLARLFTADVNALILDEPTNHLDVFSMEALQDVLSLYGGTLILVSHDRRFVDAVATRLVAFEGLSLRAFEGNLTARDAERDARSADSDARVNRTAIEMRMAALIDRVAHPKKGDDTAALNAEYDECVRKLRALPPNVDANGRG